MTSGSVDKRVDAPVEADAALVRRLEAVANLNRLLILRSLRVPRALREIDVHDDGVGAPLARQTVRRHLDVLIANDVVRTHDGAREYGETTEFVLNHQRLFSVSEEIRALARLRPAREPEGETQPHGGRSAPSGAGSALVLVSGLEEGARFDITPRSGRAEWVVGRRRGADVSLDFDSAVSSENALVRWVEGAHTVEDLPGSRNGTSVNFARLAPGVPRELRHGDIIGVGRCLLVYWR